MFFLKESLDETSRRIPRESINDVRARMPRWNFLRNLEEFSEERDNAFARNIWYTEYVWVILPNNS